MKCTIVIEDEINCRIGGLKTDHLKFLWDNFGFFVDGYRYTPQFALGKWDGKKRFFDKFGKTFTKILDEIVPHIINWDYEIDFEDKRLSIPQVIDRFSEDFFQLPDFKFRPYQVESANKLLEAGGGFGLLATGSGKTSIVAGMTYIFARANLRTIVIVPSQDLVEQTVKEIRSRFRVIGQDLEIGVFGAGLKQIDSHIVIATWQSLQNAMHHMSNFQVVIVDESHGAKANIIQEIINVHGKHIAFRYGLTGTFPKPVTDQYALKTAIGSIVCEVPAWWLIQQGFLSTIEIRPIEMQDKAKDEFPDYASEKAFISKSEGRLEVIAKQIMKARDSIGNTLVLVNSLKLGRQLAEIIPESVFLSGEDENTVRAENYAEYADRNDIIRIASVGIASTGISIDRIFVLFTIDIGKSFTRAIQSIGRSIRKSGDKSHAIVYDVYSNFKHSKKHFKIRKDYYIEAKYPMEKVVKMFPTKKDELF